MHFSLVTTGYQGITDWGFINYTTALSTQWRPVHCYSYVPLETDVSQVVTNQSEGLCGWDFSLLN